MQPLSGVKVVEVATFGFVPSGVALLADWGADVVTIEHPRVANPMRGLTTVEASDGRTVDYLMDHLNRGKRNLALDLSKPRGRDVLYELVRRSDVFVTSFLPPAQRKLKITYADLRALNRSLVFAHGHGYGPRGPDAEQPGFDGIAYWCRGGVGHALTFKDGPPARQRPGFGDVIGGLSIAAGVSAALHRKNVTGEGCAVDVSLLAVACWQLAPDILASSVSGRDLQMPAPDPKSGPYRTADGRYVTVLLLLPQYLRNTLRALDREQLLEDPVFAHYPGGVSGPGFEIIDAALRQAIDLFTVEEIRQRFDGQEIAWAVVQTPQEVVDDPQVRANEYIVQNPSKSGEFLIGGPVQFDQAPPRPRWGSPRQGEHTLSILSEMGFDEETQKELLAAGIAAQGTDAQWDEYGRFKNSGL